jgi:rhodanese-related sulfurtransferase
VSNVDAPTCPCANIVYVEVAHHASVEMQADCPGPFQRNSSDVNVIGVWNEARDRAMPQQHSTAACEVDICISASIRRESYVAALFQNSFDHADHAPASVIVNRRPLARQPDDRIQRQAFISSVIDEVSRVALRVTPVVLRLEKRTGLLDKIEHQWCESEHAVCWVGLLAAPHSSLGNEALKSRGDHLHNCARRLTRCAAKDFASGHVPRAFNLDIATELSRDSLARIVGKNEEFALSCHGKNCPDSAYASAKAVMWGFKRVYYFAAGFPAWKEAGHPVEGSPTK